MSRIYAAFDGGQNANYLPGLCLELLSEQKKAWPDCRKGYDSLMHVREREITCKGFAVHVQYNPGRIKSSLANVGEKHVTERPCFLCLDNLPEAQEGVLYRKEYLILCNPAPVFPSHFTVCHVEHRRQSFTENIYTLLQLMGDFGPGWMTLYNGPKCGASAPDHLHFQAVPSGQMPIEKEIGAEKRLIRIRLVDGVQLSRVIGLGREIIILEGDDPMALTSAFKGLLNALKEVLFVEEEPMMNIIGLHHHRQWRLLVFPRAKHRPDAFFRKGDDRVVVSPAVVEMGGLIITPLEKDFQRLDASAVEGIFREVSLDGKVVESALDVMTGNYR